MLNDIINPSFSIIIPTYNRGNLLEATIKSVQNQSFTDWECIIVDDGSTDNTKEIIYSLIEKESRIKYIYQENAERSVARNNGIKNAVGEYICFLDSDDMYKSNHLETLIHEILKKNDQKALFYVHADILTNKEITEAQKQQYNHEPDFFLRNSIIPARVCIHKEILETIIFDPQIVIVEDTVLWTKISAHFPIIQINETTVLYRWHEDNSVQIKNNCFSPRLKGLKRLFSDVEIKKFIPLSSRLEALSGCYYGMAKYHELNKRFIPMIWHILLSIGHFPKSPQTKAKIYMIYAYFRKSNI
jgi:glycosyltransferase involved in cell wall biosynthesis